MRVLLAFLLLLCAITVTPAEHPFIVFVLLAQVFTNDGTFYKLDPDEKEVAWHSSLPFKLLQVEIAPQPE